MSLGPIFKSKAAGVCAAAEDEIKIGELVRYWDDAICHLGCIQADESEEDHEYEIDTDDAGDQVLVFRGHDGHPVAVPLEIVREAERPLRAYELKQTGLSWREVALQENYPDGDAARRDVARYLKEGHSLVADFTKKELLELNVSRIETLIRACWGGALAGNPQLIGQAHGLIMSEVKLLRLDTDSGEDEGDGKGGTVIVPPDDEGYSRALERIGNRKAG